MVERDEINMEDEATKFCFLVFNEGYQYSHHYVCNIVELAPIPGTFIHYTCDRRWAMGYTVKNWLCTKVKFSRYCPDDYNLYFCAYHAFSVPKKNFSCVRNFKMLTVGHQVLEGTLHKLMIDILMVLNIEIINIFQWNVARRRGIPRRVPDRMMQRDNRTRAFTPSLLPPTDQAIQLYESSGGRLSDPTPFGTDPIDGDRREMRDQAFRRKYPSIDSIFHRLVNGESLIFKQALLFLILM